MAGILGGGCSSATSWGDLDLYFNIAVVTLIFKTLFGYILETVSCRKLLHGRSVGWGGMGISDAIFYYPLYTRPKFRLGHVFVIFPGDIKEDKC